MHAIFIGASTGCGFHSVINLLNSDRANQLTLLLRTPSRFTERPETVSLFQKKPELMVRVKIVQGDALIKEDIQKLFKEAGDEKVELVVSTVGGAPDFSNPLSPNINPPKVTERTFHNLLDSFKSLAESRQSQGLTPPRLISVSSMGLGEKGHENLPFLLKFMYSKMLKVPHDDKFEMEKLIFNASGKGNEEIGLESKDGGWLEDFIIIRPALLTSGKETKSYRVNERVPSAYTISRKDVGHFIFEKCLPGHDEFKNRAVMISY